MRKYLGWLPNFITLVNLFCGSVAIIELLNERYFNVLVLVVIALIADFTDGLLARSLRAQSIIGKDLDSLADLITFGLLPSMILYHLSEIQAHSMWNYLCFSVVIFSAIRLARFNHDIKQSYYFIGLPTPANAILILSLLVFVIYEDPRVSEHSVLLRWNAVFFSKIIYSPKSIRALSIISSVLLLFPVKLIAFKLPKFTFKEAKHIGILLIGILILIILLGKMAFFWIIVWYIFWSILWYYFIL